jgi:hypothetical protein
MTALLLLVLLSVHFVGDFVLQTNWQAQNKSKNWEALGRHVLVYSLCFAWLGANFVVATFVFHFLTDAVTSRINSKLWAEKRVHGFFVGVGADQLIHAWTLAGTWLWLK